MTTRTDTDADRALPFEAYEFVTVNFLEPNQDLLIPHDLRPEDPDRIGYMVVGNDGEGVVSDSRRIPNGRSWTREAVVLRCNRAPCTVELLLVALKSR
jgi:hypothetical protein